MLICAEILTSSLRMKWPRYQSNSEEALRSVRQNVCTADTSQDSRVFLLSLVHKYRWNQTNDLILGFS